MSAKFRMRNAKWRTVVRGRWSVARAALFLSMCLSASVVNIHAQSTEFTYQGRLLDSSLPPTANYDFEFSLWDSLVAGAQQGTTQTITGVAVANGIFTVKLNFGAQFTGSARFMQIALRPAGGPSYTTLAPRQPITSSPYSIKSATSTSADGLSAACNLCVTDAHILSIDGAKVTGTVANAANAQNAQMAVSSQNSVNAVNATNAVNAQNALSAQNSLNLGGFAADDYLRFKWNIITANQQAQPNNGYVVNPTVPEDISINLPPNPQIGDVVRISGTGAADWQITQNVGQSIIRDDGMANGLWNVVNVQANGVDTASSADGTTLFVAAFGNRIYRSTNSGTTWTPLGDVRNWFSIACSADGTKLVAAVSNGQIYTSADSGDTWTARESNRSWFSVASSADGTKLVALVRGGQIYTSIDSGVSWTPRETDRLWFDVTSSSDGTKLAAVANPGIIYISADSGQTWTPRETDRSWYSIASSADGSRLIAASSLVLGFIYISSDSGQTWVPRDPAFSGGSWNSVASSATGKYLLAIRTQAPSVYVSTNYGVTWARQDVNSIGNPISLTGEGRAASSADGTKIVVLQYGSAGMYRNPRNAETTRGATGKLIGRGQSSVELIYIGNGKFSLLNSRGNISFE